MSNLYDDIIAAADRSVAIFPLPSIDGMRVFPRYLIHSHELYELVNEITVLREENARLREALHPFANWYEHFSSEKNTGIAMSAYRAAAAALQEGGKDE